MRRTRSQRIAGIQAGLVAALYAFTVLMPSSVAASDPIEPAPSGAASAVVEATPSTTPIALPSPAEPTPSTTSSAELSPTDSPSPESLLESPAPAPAPSAEATTLIPYIVSFSRGATVQQREAALTAAGATPVSTVPALGLAVVELPPGNASLLALRASAGVARVELDRNRAAEAIGTDPRYVDQWSLPMIGWPSVTVPAGGEAIVAILDTGVDASHPDLVGRLVPGASFVGTDPLTDPNGHGTWMAGIVAATAGNDQGIAGIGSAGVRVMPVGVLGADGTGQDSEIIAGIVFATDNGADVILLAFSAAGYSAALQSAIDYAWDRGAVIVAATGNDGVSTPTYPAGDRGVIGVSNTDREDRLAAGSNFGPTTFLGAPGTDILTTGPGSTYRWVTGTSASAAEVAASAAVLKAIDPDATNAVIVGRLARSAAPGGNRDETGNGRLDLGRAAADSGTEHVVPAGVEGPADGGPFVGPYVAASSATVTTNGVTGMEPATAAQSAAKVRVLSFRITPTVGDTFKSLKVQYTGTNVADISTVFLYQEAGTVPGSFAFASETARGSTATQTAGEYTLDPADFALTAGVQVQFYVAVDLAAGATLGNLVDFKILQDKMTLTTGVSFTWPSAAQVAAGTWDPTGTTKIATAPSFGTLTAESDIGTVAFAGSSDASVGTYTVKGGGLTGPTADAFHLVYKQMTGDSMVTTRVTSVQNTNGSARAGVVMRDALAAGSMTAIVASNPTNGISFGYRLTTGGIGTETAPAASSSPYWLRLTRIGNTFRADRSPDGTAWTQVGTTQTIAMGATFYVGIGVSAGDDTQMNTSTLDNVSVTIPTADFANPNEGTAIVQVSTSVAIQWSETGPAASSRSLQRQKGAPSAAGSCATTSWAADGAAVATVSPVTQSALTTAFCYRWVQTLSGSFAYTSGSVLIDTAAATAPSVVATNTASVYQATPNGVVYFRPAAASTLTLTATGVDAESGIGKQAYGLPTVATGWTPTYLQSSADGASATWSFSSSGASTTIPVKAINDAVGIGFTTKVPSVTTSIANLTNAVAVSPDGQFAVFGSPVTPFVQAFRWAGTGFGQRLPDPVTLPTGQVWDVEFSPNGAYLALANEGATNITVYNWSSAGFGTKVANPASALGGNATGVAWSPAGDRIALVGPTSPYLAAWPFTTVFGTRFGNPGTLPAGVLSGVAFSPDGTQVATVGTTTPFVEAWNVTTAFGTKITNPATLPTGPSNDLAFSADGRAVAVAMAVTPFIHVYNWTTAGFGTKFANPATLPTGIGNAVGLDSLGQYIAVAHATTPFLSVYPWSPTGFGTKLANPAALPSGTAATGVAISPRGAVIVATDSGTTASVVGYQEETVSAARTITITADSTAPAISVFTPSANATQSSTTVTPTWTETEGGSGVASRSLQRKTGAPSPAGSCATTTWADDGTAANVPSGVAQTGLTFGSCYQWTLTVTDWVGNTSGTSTSSWIYVVGPPVLTPTVANLAYTENATIALDAGIIASDFDSANLASATVSMTTNYVNGEDTLAFVTQNGITGSWTAATGVLALTGSSSVANYQTALRSITYTDTSETPSTLARTVTFVANDGVFASNTASRQITVSGVNDAPAGTSKTVTTNEDTGHVFTTADFGFSDPTEGGAHTLLAVRISTLPAAGSLALVGVGVTIGQFVSAADVASGLLVFTAAANVNGAANASFTFQVQDTGGTANGGVDLDPSPNTITVDVTAVNDVPSFTNGADQTVRQDTAAHSVVGWATSISAGPANESSQVPDFIVSNDNNALFITQPTIGATGTLAYTLATGANGVTTVTVQIHDDGGLANGGVDTSAAQTFVITVSDGAYISSSGWSSSFVGSRYLDLTFPAYVPAGSLVTGATFRHDYRSATAGDTTCYYFEVYSGATLLATHGSAGAPVSCNSTSSYVSDAIALPEVDTVAEANLLTIRLYVKNSGGRQSAHRTADLGIVSSLN